MTMIGLYAWGANSHGQLGLGYSSEMVCEPQRVEELPAQLCESAVSCIVGGGGHTLLLTNTGTLYGAGWNNCGQVGEGTATRCVPLFRECRGLEGQVIVAASCGWAHSLACSSTGHVWVWGSNSHGQLGLPPNEVPFSSLPICLELTDVCTVAAGLRHSVVATRSGQVYTWGHGHRGQLGHLSEDGTTLLSLSSPRLLDTLETKVVSVSCGQNMTYALTSEGAVLAWGDNKWGQLAHDPRNLLFFTCPLTIPSNYFACERVCWLRSGWTHCVAGTASGSLYIWGRGDYGQLGPIPSDGDDEEGRPMLGRELLRDDGGKDEELKEELRYIPSLVTVAPDLKVDQIVCGSEHTLALVSSQDLAALAASRHHSIPTSRTFSQQFQHFSLSGNLRHNRHHTPPRLMESGTSVSVRSAISSVGGISISEYVRQEKRLLQQQQQQQLTGHSEHSSDVSLLDSAAVTDSGSLSSESDSESVALKSSPSTTDQVCASNSSNSDAAVTVQGGLIQGEEELPIIKNLIGVNELDEPSTLSPIDTPRSLPPASAQVTSAGREFGNVLDLESKNYVSSVPYVCSRNTGQSLQSPSTAFHPQSGLSSKMDSHPDGGASGEWYANALNYGTCSTMTQHNHVTPQKDATLPTPSLIASNLATKQERHRQPPILSTAPVSTTRSSTTLNPSSQYSCLYAWGWNEHGNCGLGNTANVTVPLRLPIEGRVLMVAAGSGHSFALIRSYSKVTL